VKNGGSIKTKNGYDAKGESQGVDYGRVPGLPVRGHIDELLHWRGLLLEVRAGNLLTLMSSTAAGS
jgi:hypothetical protein